QKAWIEDDEAATCAVEAFEGRALLVELAGVVRPARDDVNGLRAGLIRNTVALFSDGNRAARRSQYDCFHIACTRRIAEQSRSVNMNRIHLACIGLFTRDAPREMINLRH